MTSVKSGLSLLAAIVLASAPSTSSVARATLSTMIQAAGSQSTKTPGVGSNSIMIRLEQKKGEQVLEMHPNHVFDPGDVVRFRLTSGFDGYLYVIEQGSSGAYIPLFPAAGTSSDNLVHKGVDSLVPSFEDGWFQIEGPAGFDVVYFLVSSKPIDVSAGKGTKGDAEPSNAPGAPPGSLRPRCNDAIFQARGECIDESAGPASLTRDMPLPPQISVVTRNASRDIIFVAGDDDKSVEATAPSATPVVYIFRLAHH
jgi:hypothetical protein